MQCMEIDIFREYDFINSVFTLKSIDMAHYPHRQELCSKLGFNFENLTYNKQVHKGEVRIVDEEQIGKIKEADALITNLNKVPLLVLVADCVSIGIVDIKKKVIGAAHAGWKGTYDNISENLVNTMIKEFQCNKDDLRGFISPSIGGCCYEVDKDLYNKFNNKFMGFKSDYSKIDKEKYFLDLKKINVEILNNCGIQIQNIENKNLCTYCSNDMYHSYRNDNKTNKRMGLILELT